MQRSISLCSPTILRFASPRDALHAQSACSRTDARSKASHSRTAPAPFPDASRAIPAASGSAPPPVEPQDAEQEVAAGKCRHRRVGKS